GNRAYGPRSTARSATHPPPARVRAQEHPAARRTRRSVPRRAAGLPRRGTARRRLPRRALPILSGNRLRRGAVDAGRRTCPTALPLASLGGAGAAGRGVVAAARTRRAL